MSTMPFAIRQLSNFETAADALRRHEQPGKNLNDWQTISAGQKRRWLAKVEVVRKALESYPRGALV